MALRIWLPLNGNLENKGISDLNLTVNTAPVYVSNGKIGKAMSTGQVTMSAENMEKIFSKGTMSICFWIYINADAGNTSKRAMLFGNDFPRRYSLFQYPTCNDLHWSWANDTTNNIWGVYGNAFPSYKWTHCAVTYDKTNIKIYLNGELVRTQTDNYQPVSLNYNTILFSNCPNEGRYLNDYRIYDHTLSAKEVKEISQGLVLHYKLDTLSTGLNNLAQTGSMVVYNNYAGSGTTGTLTKLDENFNGAPVYRLTMIPNDTSLNDFKTALGSHGIFTFRQIFKANTKYCFWIYYRPVSHLDVRVGGTASNIGGWTEIAPEKISNDWYCVGQYRNGTITEDKTDNIFTSFYTPTAVSGQAIMIDFASPFLLEGTTTVDKKAYWGLNGINKIIDSSGYGNDGEVAGTLETEQNDTEGRYQIATKFSTNSCYIKLPAMTYSNFGSSYTFTWWEYMTTVSGGPMPWGFSNGNRLNCYHTTNLCWNTGDGGSNPFTPAKTAASLVDNKWHFMAITGDGTNVNLYVDGVYVAKATTWKPLTGTQIYISGWDTGTSYSMVGNKMSDFRIYATALSAEDILDLYHTPANIDNLGGIHGFEFEEAGEKDSIYKNGTVSTGQTKNYLVNNFAKTNTLTDWTFTSPTINNGIVTTTGTTPFITSKTFTVNPDDIVVVKFTLSMPTPSTSTFGQGLYLGTLNSANTNRYLYNFNTHTWGQAQSNASTSWNTYFLSGYNSTDIITIKSYILGNNVDIANVPDAYCSLSRISSTNAIQLTSGTTTNIRAGYNNGNTTMVIQLFDFEIYNLKENGIIQEEENIKTGLGYIKYSNIIEK